MAGAGLDLRRVSSLLRVAGLLGLLVVAGATIWFFRIDELKVAGPRTDYFLYLAALLVLVIGLARWPRVSGTLLVLACIEQIGRAHV